MVHQDFPKLLSCPGCGSAFYVKAFRGDGDDVEEGTLTCGGCGRLAPVIGGVPRILPPYLNRALVAHYPNYFARYDVKLPLGDPLTSFDKLNQAIFDAFNYNWVAPPSIIYLRKEPVNGISRNFFDRLAPPVSTYHTRSEIEGWYRDAGFSDVRVTRRDVNAWRGYGVRRSSSEAPGCREQGTAR